MSTKLQTLVQRMINDGRSENEIASVIRLFNNKSKASALKQTVDPDSERPLTLEEQPQFVPQISDIPETIIDPKTGEEILNPEFQRQVLVPGIPVRSDLKWGENIKNNWQNLKETVGDIKEFWGLGKEEGAKSTLNIASSVFYESLFGKDRMKKWAERRPKLFKGYAASDTEEFMDFLADYEKEKKQTV